MHYDILVDGRTQHSLEIYNVQRILPAAAVYGSGAQSV
jgi:hypothetical protein